MILFFGDSKSKVFAVETSVKLSAENLKKYPGHLIRQ